METEGPKTEHGGEEPGTINNVVPFPRDWLGPREELIPFGNSTGSEAGSSVAGPGAEAFWAGECDPLHAVVAAPATSAPIAGSRLQPLAGRLAIGALVVTVLTVVVLGRIVGVPTGGSGSAIGSDVAAAGFFDLAQLRGAVGTPTIEQPKPAAHPAVHPHARAAAHARRRHTRTPVTHSATAASSVTSVVATPTTSRQPVTQSTETSSASTHSSVSSHTASVRPGPVGPGAPFGPGQVK